MQDLKICLSVALVLSILWFGALVGLLIKINHFFLKTFPLFFVLVIGIGRNEED